MSSGHAEGQSEPVYEEPETLATPAPEATAATEQVSQAPPSLLDQLIDQVGVAKADQSGRLENFLRTRTVREALTEWFGAEPEGDLNALVMRLNRDAAIIDDILSEQINAIMHRPRFQKLEAAWRGLEYLIRCADDEGVPEIKIRVLNVSWRELERDFERSVEFDQSQLFKKVYEEEFGTPGGEPFGVLIGDYEVQSRTHPHDDMMVLRNIAQVAAASFCPFIGAANPAMFGVDDWTGIEPTFDLAKAFGQPEFIKWNALRDSEDSRFVGLTLPRVLMRLPHTDDNAQVDGFHFKEDVSGPTREKYLWGNAAFALGEVLIRTFAESGWLGTIRGVERGVEGGGLVTKLPTHHFGTDRAGVVPKTSTDVVVTDELEKTLADLGFIPLCHCYDTEYSAFYSNQSVQKPKKYETLPVTMNARMSSMLQYMLCVSRFSHYLKVIVRDQIGSFFTPQDVEAKLNQWLTTYVTPDEYASQQAKARRPLREANVQVREVPGQPGAYQAIIHLWPHFELDELSASVRVSTELRPAN
jgi:type VI secretion system ImpC/EvpB family protein